MTPFHNPMQPRSPHMNARTLILLSCLLAATPALADKSHGHAHGDGHGHSHAEEGAHDHAPKHGGIVSEANDLDFELVSQDGLRLFVRDHGEPVNTDGGSAKLTVVSKDGKQDIELAPAGEHFAGTAQLPAGARVVARVTLGGRTMAVRFAMP